MNRLGMRRWVSGVFSRAGQSDCGTKHEVRECAPPSVPSETWYKIPATRDEIEVVECEEKRCAGRFGVLRMALRHPGGLHSKTLRARR